MFSIHRTGHRSGKMSRPISAFASPPIRRSQVYGEQARLPSFSSVGVREDTRIRVCLKAEASPVLGVTQSLSLQRFKTRGSGRQIQSVAVMCSGCVACLSQHVPPSQIPAVIQRPYFLVLMYSNEICHSPDHRTKLFTIWRLAANPSPTGIVLELRELLKRERRNKVQRLNSSPRSRCTTERRITYSPVPYHS